MKHAKDLVSGISARNRPVGHTASADHFWGSKRAHPAAAAAVLRDPSGQSGLRQESLSDVSRLLGRRVLDVTPGASGSATTLMHVADSSDDDLEIVSNSAPTSSPVDVPVLAAVESALLRLQSEFEQRDEALRSLHRRAAEEERRRLAEFREKKAALRAAQSAQRRRGQDDSVDADDEADILADAHLVADFLPALLSDMVALVGGFGVVADGPIAAAAIASGALARDPRGATGVPNASRRPGPGATFDDSSLSDLLSLVTEAQTRLSHQSDGSGLRVLLRSGEKKAGGRMAVAASGGGSAQGVRRAMREQLRVAQRRQSSQLDARRKGFGSIVQLGVAKARKCVCVVYVWVCGGVDSCISFSFSLASEISSSSSKSARQCSLRCSTGHATTQLLSQYLLRIYLPNATSLEAQAALDFPAMLLIALAYLHRL